MIEQETKKTTDKSKKKAILESFAKFGSSAWKEVKDLFLSLDPQTQRMLLTAMFKINPEQAAVFAGEAGVKLPPDTGTQTTPTPKTDNTLIIIIAAIILFILVIVLLVFIMRK